MEKYYFTYGTSKQFPFQRGWTLVYAPTKQAAIEVFRVYHPDITAGMLNCCDCYSSDYFEKSEMFKDGNMGGGCHEIIGAFKPEDIKN